MSATGEVVRIISDGLSLTVARQQILARLYEKGWHCAVKGDRPQEPSDQLLKTDDASLVAWQASVAKYDCASSAAKGVLFKHMNADDFELLGDLSALEIWRALHRKYQAVQPSVKQKAKGVQCEQFITNYAKIRSIRISESDDMETALAKVHTIGHAIDAINNLDRRTEKPLVGTWGPVAKVGVVLFALPQSFSNFIQSWIDRDETHESCTFDVLVASLTTAYTVTASHAKSPGKSTPQGKSARIKGFAGDFDCYTCKVKHDRNYQCDGWKMRQAKIKRSRGNDLDQVKALLMELLIDRRTSQVRAAKSESDTADAVDIGAEYEFIF